MQRHFILGSGDITSYINFFSNFENWTNFKNTVPERPYFSFTPSPIIKGEGLFRLIIFATREFFNQTTLAVLGYIAFTISSLTFWIYLINIRSKKYLLHIIPLFLMVFLTPRVMDLFASGVRSGIAFTILLFAIVYLKGVSRYIFFGLSSAIHFSMLPILSIYILFYLVNNKTINYSFLPSITILIIFTVIIAFLGKKVYYNIGVNTGSLYNLSIYYLGILMIFLNKKVIKNIYGFLALGFILTVISGHLFNFSFIRYVGNGIILYLFFLIKEGEIKNIQTFTICYAPFFVLTQVYKYVGYW